MRYRFYGAICLALALSNPVAAEAAVGFEGFYTFERDGKTVGLGVQRDEIDDKDGTLKTTYFVRLLLQSIQTDQFVIVQQDRSGRPLAYKSISRTGDASQHVDARSNGKSMSLQIRMGTSPIEVSEIPLGNRTFLSSYLGPLLMHKKPRVGQAYSFEAIHEEEGKAIQGEVLILDARRINERHVYRSVIRYLAVEQEVWFLDDGIVLMVSTTGANVTARLVADRQAPLQAMKSFEDAMVKYFGSKVSGKNNPISRGLRIDGDLFPKNRDLSAFGNVPRIPLRLMQ